MHVRIRKWGASAAIQIPAQVMAVAALSLDQAVDVRAEGGRVIIEPVVAPVYDLGALLDRMTPDTFHEDVDFGPPTGAEIW